MPHDGSVAGACPAWHGELDEVSEFGEQAPGPAWVVQPVSGVADQVGVREGDRCDVGGSQAERMSLEAGGQPGNRAVVSASAKEHWPAGALADLEQFVQRPVAGGGGADPVQDRDVRGPGRAPAPGGRRCRRSRSPGPGRGTCSRRPPPGRSRRTRLSRSACGRPRRTAGHPCPGRRLWWTSPSLSARPWWTGPAERPAAAIQERCSAACAGNGVEVSGASTLCAALVAKHGIGVLPPTPRGSTPTMLNRSRMALGGPHGTWAA